MQSAAREVQIDEAFLLLLLIEFVDDDLQEYGGGRGLHLALPAAILALLLILLLLLLLLVVGFLSAQLALWRRRVLQCGFAYSCSSTILTSIILL